MLGVTSEVRRIRLARSADAVTWDWTDAVTGETGHVRVDREGFQSGDEAVVELARDGLGWVAVRWLELPPHISPMPDGTGVVAPEPILVNGAPLPASSSEPELQDLAVGTIRRVFHHMDSRSAAARDADRSTKSRPAVILSIDEVHGQVEVCFVYGTNSAVHRSGRGRRLRDWHTAGLRKPSVASAESEVCAISDLGPVVGHLSDADLARITG